jgi:hypothetical protein
MNDPLSEALELYAEARNGLVQHDNDLEALRKVVIAADNLAETIGQEKSTQFIASLTKYLEDGQKAGKLSADDVKDFISNEYKPKKPQGAARNQLIRLVKKHLPELSYRKLAPVVGTDIGTVSRVLNGNDTGGGDQGHGGARRSSPDNGGSLH